MNKRQKKKRYKKLYGHNPPKKYRADDILATVNDLERIATAMRDLSSRIQYTFGVTLEGLGKAIMKAGQAMQENTLEQKGEQNAGEKSEQHFGSGFFESGASVPVDSSIQTSR